MWQAFIGAESIASGELTRGKLRWSFRAVHPGVYLPKDAELTLFNRTAAAWLHTGRTGIIAGRAAAALHGAKWTRSDDPIELIAKHGRPRPGITIREERIAPDEIVAIAGMPVTSPARTAFDLARHLVRNPAVMRLDALAAATGVTRSDAMHLVERYRGARNTRAARLALALMDAGAQSPKETWLRMVVYDAGLPKPRTQIRVSDGMFSAFIDLGWDEPKVGLDYEGAHHFSDRGQIVHDIDRYEMIDRQGWLDLRVVAEHRPRFIESRIRDAFAQRDYTPSSTPWW